MQEITHFEAFYNLGHLAHFNLCSHMCEQVTSHTDELQL